MLKIPKKIAVVVPFNLHLDSLSGSVLGSLIAHKSFADRHCAVFWGLWNARPHPEVKTAYFYDAEEKAVTFKSRVEIFDKKENIEKSEEKFVPNYRKEYWDAEESLIWLKLRDICPLKRKRLLSEFTKWDGGRLESVRNFALVVDAELEAKTEKITVDLMIDDHLYRLITQENEKLQEKDIEEMLWNLMEEKNLEFIDRQRGRDNRIDIAFKDSKGGLIVIEIKKGSANIRTLDQIKRYMREIMTNQATDKISGIILCKKADVKLQEAVMNEKNIVIDEYKFSISFPKIEERIA